MRRVLVTGGAGFLGSHLCKKLLQEKNYVICVDNFYTGCKENIKKFLTDKKFTLIQHDISCYLDLKNKIDLIFNLACPASPPHYQKDPIFTTRTSVFGTLNMLELARKHNARFIQASTSEVYGDPQENPQKECYRGAVNPIGIRSCYDEGKRCAESLIFDYHRRYNLDVKVIRIFNTYGPNMDLADGRVVSNFIVQALEKKPITIYGEGTQTRSFCYVDDLISGIFFTAAASRCFTGPVNLGNPYEFNLLTLAQKILQLTCSSSKISFLPLPEDDPTQRCPDITLARSKLGWKPKIMLEEGLTKTIKYFKITLKKRSQHNQKFKNY
jgi:UDP-glucuronate decarboxylase